MIDQISIFLENSAGQLSDITAVLAEAGVDIRALNVTGTSDYGVLRIITDDTDRTVQVLSDNRFVATKNQVVAVSLPDRPGALHEVLGLLASENMNIPYMYSVFSQRDGRAYMVIRLEDPEKGEALLSSRGIHVADRSELYAE